VSGGPADRRDDLRLNDGQLFMDKDHLRSDLKRYLPRTLVRLMPVRWCAAKDSNPDPLIKSCTAS
jgi:hypothetical protein